MIVTNNSKKSRKSIDKGEKVRYNINLYGHFYPSLYLV